jgi:hypothetical protein
MFIADSHGYLDHSVWDLPRSQRDALSIELGRLLQGKNSQGENYLRGIIEPSHIKPENKQYVRRGQKTSHVAHAIQVKPTETKEDMSGLRQRVLNSYQELSLPVVNPILEIKEERKMNSRKQMGTVDTSTVLEAYEPSITEKLIAKHRLPAVELSTRQPTARQEVPEKKPRNWSFFGFSFPN